MSGSAAAPKTGGTPDGVDVVQSCRTFTPGEVERQESEFRKGDVVCITQLKKNPQLNWRLGVVVKPSDTYEGRVGVRLLCQGENDYMLHGLKPVNIFTVPRDVTPTMITNLIAFGVPVSDGKLLVKHFDFKYTPAPPSSLPSSPAPRRVAAAEAASRDADARGGRRAAIGVDRGPRRGARGRARGGARR